VLVAAVLPATVRAAEWSSTEVQLLHGDGFKLGDESREIITLEHVSGWRFGSNFFFFDINQPFADGTNIYGEWYSRFSLQRLRGREEYSGAVKDLSLAVAINAGEGFRAYLAGATVHFNAPGFTYLDLDVMAYDDRSYDGVTYIVTPAWDRPFALGRVKLRCRGFIDLIGAEGEAEQQVIAQPQLLLDLGSLWGNEGKLWTGVEYQLWKNKYGIDGIDESFAQLMIVWQL
jgi:nucleoside-specific outer membrane channel protein Tsx